MDSEFLVKISPTFLCLVTQLDTWDKSKRCQTRIMERIREMLEERIARERNTGVERTMGYSDNLEVLRQEYGMCLEEADSQFIQYPAVGQEDIRGQVNYEAQAQTGSIV